MYLQMSFMNEIITNVIEFFFFLSMAWDAKI